MQQAAQPGFLEMMVPFIFIFVVFYFLIIRPQGKKQKDHQLFLTALKRGDEVLTASGILGRIEGITDQYVTLEIADGVRIKMLRNQVAASSKSIAPTAKTVIDTKPLSKK
jgi:preprotein translocase subunit YajC